MLNEFNGLNPGEIMVLVSLKRLCNGGTRRLTIGEIAFEAIRMPYRTASRHVNALVRKGRVARKWHSNHDMRYTVVQLHAKVA
jgi:DNA-binding MarR family transcriptional regulator